MQNLNTQNHVSSIAGRFTRMRLRRSLLMPLFCELDEVMITLQHGVLHREQTLADGGEYCDYFVTGNNDKAEFDT